ncbi:MAG: hypothetical protein HYY84_18640 [Deltaproteobacteria bacterium]|nr:hypothetical protein [Deltaproteobacteria bacterium]
MLKTRIRKIGNSHGILLPSQAIRYWRAKSGTEVELVFDADRLIIRPVSGDRDGFVRALDEVLDEDEAILRDLAK